MRLLAAVALAAVVALLLLAREDRERRTPERPAPERPSRAREPVPETRPAPGVETAAEPEAAPESADVPARDIRLTFVDPEGRAVEGARVLVYDAGAPETPVARLRTDGAGVVVLGLGERLRASASAPGHATTIVGVLKADRRVEMAWARHVGGRVEDAAGRPVAGATVDVGRRYKNVRPDSWRRVTADDGSFRFDDVGPGRHLLVASKRGYAKAGAWVWPDEPAARLVLRRMASVSGSVVFEDGRPAAGAHVYTKQPTRRCLADPDGGFAFDDLDPGERTIVAWTDSHYVTCPVELAEGEARTRVRIVLRPRVFSYVRYRVIDHDGALVRDDALRRFTKPPGSEVAVHVRGRLSTTVTLTTALDPEVVTVRLPAPRRVEVAVLDEDGAPVRALEAKPSPGRIETLAAGLLTLQVHPDRRFALELCADGFAARLFRNLDPAASPLTLTLRRAPCEIVGRVLTHTGAPYQGRVSAGHARASVGADGTFALRNLVAGPATLHVWGRSVPLELRAGRHDVGTIRLPAPTVVRGHVFLPDGRPAAQAEVRLHDRTTGVDGPSMETRSDGSFELTYPVTESCEVCVEADGYAAAFAPTAPPPRIVLRRGGTIRVLAGASGVAWLYLSDGRRRWHPRTRGRGSEWTLEGIPAGRWDVIRPDRYEGDQVVATCTVVAGETTVVRLD